MADDPLPDGRRARRRGSDHLTRRLGAAAAAVALTGSCSSSPAPSLEGLGLRQAVLAFVAAQQDDGRSAYVPPEEAAASDLASAVVLLGLGRADEARSRVRPHDYSVVALDAGVLALVPATLPDDRGWGLYAVRPDGLDLAVEVPHPRADLATEDLGAELAVATGARYLLLAGAERRAADEQADVARESESVFSVVHARLAEAGTPALQVHGFAADSLPGVDLVVSPGSSALSPLVRAVASAGSDAGLAVCRPWRERCGRLEGRGNVQGRASRDAGAAFVHLEVTRALRGDDRREALVRLLAGAVRP